ncbi:hypothetical protein FGW37_08435 [Streptomyces rectiverticillatus]|uniref:hypothetical protein n=1 Tax=Streptomyces rectiverticillatus TaxID=173860 RepID=UPI0015C3FC4F|nr:hypothetical protein [Streptomyces rectiverticillatus]QLE71625.1 hypothetical protein FGW37_08435 [Streptomyces rectiverticillatus]
MSAKTRIAAATVLAAAVGAVAWPTASAFAADLRTTGDTDGGSGRPGRPVIVQQVQLPDGSRARLTSGERGTTVTVTKHGKLRHTFDAARPTAHLDRLHLRILGGDTQKPTLRASLDGTGLTNYYDFASGTLRHTPDGAESTTVTSSGAGHDKGAKHARGVVTVRNGSAEGHEQQATPPARTLHAASSNPVKRVVEAGEVIKVRHDIGTPALAGGAGLLALGGGAYGMRRLAARRAARTRA